MSGSVSLINGHIDPDKRPMTFEDVKRIRKNPTAEDVDNRELHRLIDEAIEKQVPKKLDGKDEDDLVCGCHKCGEVNALWKMNGDRNRYCGNCGQAIDWSYTE